MGKRNVQEIPLGIRMARTMEVIKKYLNYPLITSKRLLCLLVIVYCLNYLQSWLDYRIYQITMYVIKQQQSSGTVENGEGEPAPLNHSNDDIHS